VKRFNEYLLKFEKNAAKILLLVMVVLIFASAIARFLGYPINWAVDMSTFMFAWSCFFSVDVAWMENKMMSVDVFIKRLSPKIRGVLYAINLFVISGFLVYLIIWGFYLSYTTRFRTFVGIPNFSYTWVTLSVPVGAVLMFRTSLIKLKRFFTGQTESSLDEGSN